jgi:hypothetical protein
VDGVEIECDRRDDGTGMQRDELEGRCRERAVGADPLASDQREPDSEQQVDQRDDRNERSPPSEGCNLTRPAARGASARIIHHTVGCDRAARASRSVRPGCFATSISWLGA